MENGTHSSLYYYYPDDKPNISFEIRNSRSHISSFYQLKVPFQVTYEYCSGTKGEDYLNVFTLSGDKSYFSQESYECHNHSFHHRAPHFHDYFEFMIILEGTVIQKIEDKEYIYNTGSCCLINRNLCHKENFNSPAKVLFLGLSAEFITELFESHKSAYFVSEKEILNSKLCQFIAADIKSPGKKAYLDFIPAYQNRSNDSHLHDIAEKLIQLFLHPAFGSSYQIKGIICALLQYLSSSQNYHCTCMELNLNNDYLLFSRISHLLEERDGRMSRTELENTLNYSSDYLNRITNKYAGLCLFDYGMTFCLKKAEQLLSGTDDSISSIVSRLHFTNRTHFYSLFKGKYGMTPNEYRKQNRK